MTTVIGKLLGLVDNNEQGPRDCDEGAEAKGLAYLCSTLFLHRRFLFAGGGFIVSLSMEIPKIGV